MILSFGLKGNENYRYPGLLGCLLAGDIEAGTPYNLQTGKFEKYNPFIKSYQEDWAARARWCYQEYSEANHAPVVEIKNTNITAKPSEHVAISADVFDPDYDEVKTVWEIYPQYNHYGGKANLLRVWEQTSLNTYFTVPDDAKAGDEFVLILRAQDVNETPMTTYGVVTIKIN